MPLLFVQRIVHRRRRLHNLGHDPIVRGDSRYGRHVVVLLFHGQRVQSRPCSQVRLGVVAKLDEIEAFLAALIVRARLHNVVRVELVRQSGKGRLAIVGDGADGRVGRDFIGSEWPQGWLFLRACVLMTMLVVGKVEDAPALHQQRHDRHAGLLRGGALESGECMK